eukprot:161941-Prymnesium_polylepis.1
MRSWAFGAAFFARSCCSRLSSPVMPAAASACPIFALTPPTESGVDIPARADSTAALREPASMGSPSDVPVP